MDSQSREYQPSVYESEEIAIVGISGKYPLSENSDTFWKNLKNGKNCITEVPTERWDAELYFNTEKGVTGKSYTKWGDL
ncbi:beta-ketoacyl synthase N-terminal-like domain-containing protein [Bacillus cereus]